MKCGASVVVVVAAGGGKVGEWRITPASTFRIFMCRRRGFHLSAGFVSGGARNYGHGAGPKKLWIGGPVQRVSIIK
jgi:hypothetical protein